MALSKVLQKMAKKHQPTEDAPAPAPSSAKSSTEQDAASAGILLSLLTEPPQRKPPGQPSTAEDPPSSPSKHVESTANNSDGEKQEDTSNAIESDKFSSKSVLLQLLQEKKLVLEQSSKGAVQEQEDRGNEIRKGAVKEPGPKPIIITPDTGDHAVAQNGPREKVDVAVSGVSSTKGSTLCQICQRGFWDPAKYTEHMKSEHSFEEDPHEQSRSEVVSSSRDGTPESSILAGGLHIEESMAPSKTPSPSSTPDTMVSDEGGLRRSKRKRRPARRKYVNEEVQGEEDELEDEQEATRPPKVQVKGDDETTQHLRIVPDGDNWSVRSDDGKQIEGHRSTRRSDNEDHMEARERSASTGGGSGEGTIDEIVSYRCSQCFLYFNNREETRIHLRQAHNILTFSGPPKPPTPSQPEPLATGIHKSCTACGCKGQANKSPTSISKNCVICGKSQSPGSKSFINIFRARTWSARHHQLAKRLTAALGCEFSVNTCKSRHVCLDCVKKLESVEKARMQLHQMVKSLRRTQLVTSVDHAKSKGFKQKIGKTKTLQNSSEGNSSSVSNSNIGQATGRRGSSNQVPSAPLVRELLSAQEVVLPQSQFTELIDALGSDRDSSAASNSLSLSRADSPASSYSSHYSRHEQDTSRRSSGSMGQSEKRRPRQSRRQPAIQHDDAAFSEFVNELQGRHPPQAVPSHIGPEMGRVLAEVRVKQEPQDSELLVDHQRQLAEQLSLLPSQEAAAQAAAAAVFSGDYTDGGTLGLIEDLRSLYTKLQIDSRSGQTEYTCSLCSTSFYSEAAIQLHVKCHMPRSKELQCFLCGYHNNLLPSQWRIMKRHLESEHDFPESYFHRFPCPVKGCAELFKCHRDMVMHVSKVHRTPVRVAREHALADTGLFNFPCHMCGTLLQSEAALEVHVLCHNGSPKHYQCCYCNYMHNSQPGSWRIMRGHLSKEHVGKELASDTFTYSECPYYACRLKFCSKKAQIVHRACHDETRDGEFFCFQCHFSVPATPYLWEKVRDHIIAKHPEAVGESFRCTCKARFHTYREFIQHLNQMQGAIRN